MIIDVNQIITINICLYLRTLIIKQYYKEYAHQSHCYLEYPFRRAKKLLISSEEAMKIISILKRDLNLILSVLTKDSLPWKLCNDKTLLPRH